MQLQFPQHNVSKRKEVNKGVNFPQHYVNKGGNFHHHANKGGNFT